jgi:hypothetical protein
VAEFDIYVFIKLVLCDILLSNYVLIRFTQTRNTIFFQINNRNTPTDGAKYLVIFVFKLYIISARKCFILYFSFEWNELEHNWITECNPWYTSIMKRKLKPHSLFWQNLEKAEFLARKLDICEEYCKLLWKLRSRKRYHEYDSFH